MFWSCYREGIFVSCVPFSRVCCKMLLKGEAKTMLVRIPQSRFRRESGDDLELVTHDCSEV